jgi:hypothetical protein
MDNPLRGTVDLTTLTLRESMDSSAFAHDAHRHSNRQRFFCFE